MISFFFLFLLFYFYFILFLFYFILFYFIFLVSFCPFRAEPAAYGSSQVKGLIGAVAAGLYHSNSNNRSELRLQPHHSSRQHQILNPLRESRDRTRIIMDSNLFHFHCTVKRTPPKRFLGFFNDVYFFHYRWFRVFCRFSTVQQRDSVTHVEPHGWN